MTAHLRFLRLLLAALALACISPAVLGQLPRLKVSDNGRFLVHEDGSPFFWLGDTNWRLYKLAPTDVNRYLDDRVARGFNLIQGPVLLHDNVGAEATNFRGDHNTDPLQPTAAWFSHIDAIIDAAAQRGLYIAPVVVWGDSVGALGATLQQRIANAGTFGRWLGERYRDRTNVIWIVGGEYGLAGYGTEQKQVWNALGNGLRTGSSQQALITIHPASLEGWQSSSNMFQNAGWLSFNMLQSSNSGNTGAGADNWHLVSVDYQQSPVHPVIDGEAHYEGLTGWDAFGVRRRAYWSVFAGAFGHTYGSISVAICHRAGDDTSEGADVPWDDELNLPGARQMVHLRRLMESRPMLKRVPGDGMLVSPLGNLPNRIAATRDSLGRYAMIYVPQRNKTFIVNTNPVKGQRTRAWWYDCRTGATRGAGRFPHGGVRIFTTPDEGQDWVLVLDDDAQGFAKPGVGGPMW